MEPLAAPRARQPRQTRPASPTPVIDVRGLVKIFGRGASATRALNGLDLSVAPGEVAGFLGPNGAGKSTTLRILLGMIRADSGRARLFGADPWDDAVALHERLAYVGVPSAGHPDPRLAGWRRVLAQRRLRASEPVAIGWSVETGLRSAAAVRASRATGVLCGNDDLAIGLVAGLAREGVEVPRDVSVVGVDDHPHAVGMVPALTTVRLDFAGVGEAAARLALGIEVGPVVEVPSQLVVRDSTAPPA